MAAALDWGHVVLVVIVPVVVDIAAPHSLDAALGGCNAVIDRTRTNVN